MGGIVETRLISFGPDGAEISGCQEPLALAAYMAIARAIRSKFDGEKGDVFVWS